jgi:hypothetical protein
MPGVVRGASQRQHGIDVTVERIADEQDAHGETASFAALRSLAARRGGVLNVCKLAT